jgi:pimeloyl-ACP methyl ester carboxylesterase
MLQSTLTKKLVLLILPVCVLFTLGCSSGSYLKVRERPNNPLARSLGFLSSRGPRPAARTREILRRYDLNDRYESQPQQTFVSLRKVVQKEPEAEVAFALAELAYVDGFKAESALDKQKAFERYSAAVAHAYLYLFDERYDNQRNPYDPQFRRACEVYNAALESTLRLAKAEGKLKPGHKETIAAGSFDLDFTIEIHGPWNEDEIKNLLFVSDYTVEGLTVQHHTYGLGVPLIAERQPLDESYPKEKYYPQGLSFPLTAFLRVGHDHGEPGSKHRSCVLELHDPLAATDITVANRRVPLETDLSVPLAYFLDKPTLNPQAIATWGLLDPSATEIVRGVYMLEPFDPEKIPVIMVHGLWSSPITWMEMANDLRSLPEIRKKYQFWFYLYPTGQPFWISGAGLRQDLKELRQTLDPQQNLQPMDEMVLIGHSMGGLVSKLQTMDSKNDVWNLVSEQPFDELQTDDATRKELENIVFFKANPSVKRVITIGTPHRGSEFSNGITQYAAQKLIRLPSWLRAGSRQLLSDNPGFFKNTRLLAIDTSIDSLAPDSPIFPVMLEAEKPEWLTYHCIMGRRPKSDFLGRYTRDGDGVVSIASARAPRAASELIVESDHVNVHADPASTLEVRRILQDHLKDVNSRLSPQDASANQWATFEQNQGYYNAPPRDSRFDIIRQANRAAQQLPPQSGPVYGPVRDEHSLPPVYTAPANWND